MMAYLFSISGWTGLGPHSQNRNICRLNKYDRYIYVCSFHPKRKLYYFSFSKLLYQLAHLSLWTGLHGTQAVLNGGSSNAVITSTAGARALAIPTPIMVRPILYSGRSEHLLRG
jgi:hypothetical protein